MLYAIWSQEHGQWWKPNGNGYTDSFNEAGLFNLEDAIRNCKTFVLGKYNEMMVPVTREQLQERVEAEYINWTRGGLDDKE